MLKETKEKLVSPLTGAIFGLDDKQFIYELSGEGDHVLVEVGVLNYHADVHDIVCKNEEALPEIVDTVMMHLITQQDVNTCTVAVDPTNVYMADVLVGLGFEKKYHLMNIGPDSLTRHVYYRKLQ